MILNGKLMSDEYDYDVETHDKRVSVKVRKGTTGNWQTTSLIPRVDSEKCTTRPMFIRFAEDYLLNRVWEFPWNDLLNTGRFKEKKIRGEHRGYCIRIKPSIDEDYLIYSQER